MKKIFIFSIQHTGTFFASAMISAAFKKEYQLRIGSLYSKHIKLGHTRFTNTSPIELSDFTRPYKRINEKWFNEAILSVCSEEDLLNKKIIVGHEHHHKANSWLIKSLAKNPAKIPIIIPMRDPLLSLHSKLWREDEQHHNPNELNNASRKSRLNKWIIRYKEVLSLPKGNVFLLPIDAEQSKSEEERLLLIEEMYDYCDVNFNERAKAAALKWSPENRTRTLIQNLQESGPKPKWENFKKKYLEGDIDHTREFMSLEFDQLKQEQELKDLMKKAGYKDVLWW